MKNIVCAAIVAATAAIVGCTPTPESMKATATSIGYAAGLVANQTDIKDDARNAVVKILNDVRSCIPEPGQSFKEAWAPVIDAKVKELVEFGRVDEATGELIKYAANTAAVGIDYMFDVRFPDAKKYEELVRAGASGAIDGFLLAFKPSNCSDGECPDCVARANAKKNYDKNAYEWISEHSK